MPAQFDLNKTKAYFARKIVKVANSGARKQAFGIKKVLEPLITKSVDSFFQSVVPLLGHLVDLDSQVSIPGLAPWKPLSLAYIKRKANALFFLQTALQSSRPGRHRSVHELLTGGGPSLIETLSKNHGFWAFGNTKIRVTDWQDFPVTEFSTFTLPPTVYEVKFHLYIHLWGDLKKADLPRFEQWLERQGIFDHHTFQKLTNPRGVQRPLLRAWLSHYANVVIPDVIEQALNKRYPHKYIVVRVVKPFDTGPF